MPVSESALNDCLDRALAALKSRRHPDGYWEGRLASSPLATAVALCALAEDAQSQSGIRNPKSEINIEAAWHYVKSTQNPDGGWGDTDISKSNLAATLLVLSADAMANSKERVKEQKGEGAAADLPSPLVGEGRPERSERGVRGNVGLTYDQHARAKAYTDKLGGLRDGLKRVYGKDLTFQVPIRMTAACAGLIPWTDVDALPFELALAPRKLMGALRLPVVSYALPALVCVGLSRHAKAPSWFLPLRWLRNYCTERALDLILKMQPESGGYLEAIPITAFCLLGLKAAGRGDYKIAQNARKFLLNTQREDGSWPVEVNLSVWNTTRAIDALAAGGLLESALSEAERNQTRDWILAQQTKDKSVYSDAQPGGWGWNHLSGSVPDVDDTSGAILALRELGLTPENRAVLDGLLWLSKLQNNDHGWPTFCRGWGQLPFDRSAPDLTAHALRALPFGIATQIYRQRRRMLTSNGYYYLAHNQNKDGSFNPLWFGCEFSSTESNLTYGTSQVLLSVADINDEHFKRWIHNKGTALRALSWLRSIQNPDGGFGGCKGAPSTAEETGLALRALIVSGVSPDEECCSRAAQWLIDHQRADGSWNPAPIGFYFAVLWYYEEMYPLVYALGGLGAYARALGARASNRASNKATTPPVH